MRLIKSESHATGQVLFKLPKGRYAGLFVRWTGTNNAAVQLLITELGRLSITHQNVEIANIRPQLLILLTNLYGGVPENASAVGAAFAYSFIVPFRTKTDGNNVLPVMPDKTELTIKGYNTAKVASGTIEVYALYSEGVPKYVPLLKEFTMDFAGAATKSLTYGEEFIEQLHILDDANIDKIQVVRDGQSVIDGTFNAVQSFSDASNKVEAGVTLVEVLAQKSEFLQNVRETQIQIVASGAIAELVTFYMAAARYGAVRGNGR